MKAKLEIIALFATIIATLVAIYILFFGDNIVGKMGWSIYGNSPNYTAVLPLKTRVSRDVTITPEFDSADIATVAVKTVEARYTADAANKTSIQPIVQAVRPATYTLQNGEFIHCIARRFDLDAQQTYLLNGLVNSETLQPGLTIKIPTTGHFDGPRALRAHPATYIVRSGETIYSIACLFGDVDPMNIAAVNGLAAPYSLTVGEQIQIP